MKKRTLFCIVKLPNQTNKRNGVLIMKNIISQFSLKELEKITFRVLQESFSNIMSKLLVELDQLIANNRDKQRFELKDKRKLSFDSMFGHVELRRNYYLDRDTGKYLSLLDRHLDIDGGQMMSPAVQDLAIELAVTGVSYRQASDALEKLLGYPVISHEGIRQQVLQTDVVPKEKQSISGDVIFVEVDGLYTKSQEKGRKGRELKISAVHEGWEMNGKRAKLINKQHFIHEGKLPFWEEFENFLMESYDYDPTRHHLVINGDGARWITSCQNYFQKNATFVIDRFHVARDIQRIFRQHPRYRTIRRKFIEYDVDAFMIELNSAVGTLNHERKEEQLENLISQLSQYPEALEDYQKRLKEKGINTSDFRPMGSGEGTMSVFAKRLKNGRSWCKEGITKFSDVMVALMDGQDLITQRGAFQRSMEVSQTKHNQEPPKHFVERLTNHVQDMTRNNISYLQQSIRKPVVAALKGLKGY